jgi:hypothetical protein
MIWFSDFTARMAVVPVTAASLMKSLDPCAFANGGYGVKV